MRKRDLPKLKKEFDARGEGYLPGMEPDFLMHIEGPYWSNNVSYAGSTLRLIDVDPDKEKPLLVEGIEGKHVWICHKHASRSENDTVVVKFKGMSEQEYLEAQEAKRQRALNPYCEDRFGKRLKDSLAGYYPSRVVYQHRGKMNDSIVKSIKWSKENNVVITMNNDDKLIFSLSDGDIAGQKPETPLICDEIVVMRR